MTKQNPRHSKTTLPKSPTNPVPQLTAVGYFRLWQIIGCKKRGIPPLIPVGSTAWWNGIKLGIYPQPVKIGSRSTAWKASDIKDLMTKIDTGVL